MVEFRTKRLGFVVGFKIKLILLNILEEVTYLGMNGTIYMHISLPFHRSKTEHVCTKRNIHCYVSLLSNVNKNKSMIT